jgi:hypothetical protein
MFKITDGKGFNIEFANGYKVSVQFGSANYCENRNGITDPIVSDYSKEQVRLGKKGSATAEIAGWNPDGDWCRPDDWDDDVNGWCTPAQVLEYMNWMASQPAPDVDEDDSDEESNDEIAAHENHVINSQEDRTI